MPDNCLYCKNKAVLDELMIKIADLAIEKAFHPSKINFGAYAGLTI